MRVGTVKVKWAIVVTWLWTFLPWQSVHFFHSCAGSRIQFVHFSGQFCAHCWRNSDVQKNMVWTGKQKLLVECFWGIYVLNTCYIVMLACNLLLLSCVTPLSVSSPSKAVSGDTNVGCCYNRKGVQGVKQSSEDRELLLSLLLMPEIFSHHSFI
jgi:hypothetical protein